jgi:hypothetical protein
MTIQQALIERIRLADRQGANALLDAWATEHGYECLVTEVLDPTLILIGEEWCSSETFTLAQVYVAAKVTEDVSGKLAAGARTAASCCWGLRNIAAYRMRARFF